MGLRGELGVEWTLQNSASGGLLRARPAADRHSRLLGGVARPRHHRRLKDVAE